MRVVSWSAVAAAVAASLVVAALFVLVEVPRDRAVATAQVHRQLSWRADVRRDAVDLWLGGLQDDVEYVASMPSAVALTAGRGGDPAHLDEVLRREIDSHGLRGAAVLDAALRPVTAMGDIAVDAGFRRALQAVMRHGPSCFLAADHRGAPLVVAGAPIRPSADSAPVGAAFVATSPDDWLFGFLTRIDLPYPTGESFLVLREGGKRLALSPRGLEAPRERVLSETRALRNAPWAVVVRVGESAALAPFREHVRQRVLFGVTVALALVAAAWGAAKKRAASIATAMAHAERERRTADERIQTLLQVLDQSPASVVITDPRGDIEYVNRTFEAVTGWPIDEVRGKNPRILKSDLVSKETYAELWRTITSGGVWRGELVNRRKDGTLFTEQASISAVRDVSGTTTHYVAVKLDVTHVKETGQALEETRGQLLQAQKMEAVGRLAGGVAHDFNNLLTVIRGYAEILRSSLPADDARTGPADEILQASQRAADLTRQLLAFSRRQVLEPSVLELDGVLEQMEGMLRRLIGEDIHVEVVIRRPLGPVLVDRGQLEQVVMNLAVNARDAMPHGGRLTLALEEELVEQASLDGLGPPAGRYVALEVADTGAGIAPEALSHVFEPFFTTKEPGKGTGLGLATVYGIVQQSNGFISVRSEPGCGATFRILLPRFDGRPEAAPAPSSGPHTPLRPATILLVEDEEGVRRLASTILSEAGYRVLAAAGPAEALALAEGHLDGVDLLLTDVVMPGGSGPDLARRLVARRPSLKVLYTSGYIAAELGQHRVLGTDVLLVQKPFTRSALLRKTREALEGA